MYIPFEQLPPHARVWIYQSSRPFTDEEISELQPKLEQFVNEWTTHGKDLHASAGIMHHQFLVIAADEAVQASSGCSIDSSVRFVRELETAYGVSFFDRTKLAFQENGKIRIIELSRLKDEIAQKKLTKESMFFDNLVTTQGELKNSWVKPAKNSWLAKYF